MTGRALWIRLFLALVLGGAAKAGVVAHYSVNGKTAHEGATFEELRTVAGDPRAIEPVDGNDRQVEWVYHCAGAGAGRCRVVDEGGRREMRARFSLGRLKLIRYERL